MQTNVRFDATRDESNLINKIVERAFAFDSSAFDDRLSLTMDIEAAHSNGCRLDLDRWLAADQFNFMHDVYGISRHLNRETGNLENFFRPRFAARIAA